MLNRLYKYITRQRWELGFVSNTLEEIVNGCSLTVNWVKHEYKDRWFADPFILKVDSQNIILLVEELKYVDNKGVISKLVIDKNTFEITERQTILEFSTHLSFPAILRDKQHVYFYPENSAAGYLKLYEYWPENDKCKEIKVISPLPLTDAIFFETCNRRFIFSTQLSNPNGSRLSILELDESYKQLNASFFDFKESIARNAGDLFVFNNKLFRPAQECNSKYGHSISIQEVIIDDDNINFREVARLKNPSKRYTEGFHTLNTYNGVTVIDVRGFVHPVIGKWLFRLKNRLVK